MKKAEFKKEGGVIEKWQLHHLDIKGSEETFYMLYPEFLNVDIEPMMFTGTVVDDPSGRWSSGHHMRSSLILSIDREIGKIVTLNTIYTMDMKTENQDLLPDIGNGVLNIFY